MLAAIELSQHILAVYEATIDGDICFLHTQMMQKASLERLSGREAVSACSRARQCCEQLGCRLPEDLLDKRSLTHDAGSS